MPLQIYYLDDETALVEIFCDLFSSPSVQITGFSDSNAFLNAVRANPPDLLVMDHILPGITGSQLAQQIDASIPKAAVSGDPDGTPKEGFEVVFAKPFDEEKIQTWIRSHLNP